MEALKNKIGNRIKKSSIIALTLALVLFLPLALLAQDKDKAEDKEQAPEQPLMNRTIADAMRNGRIMLNFENIDIKVLARMMSELTGKNIMVDPNVKGKVTILSSRGVTVPEAWDIFKAALVRYGFSVQNKGNYVQIVPVNAARAVGPVVNAGITNPQSEEMVIAVLILKQTNPESIEKTLKPLISENGALTVYKEGQAILVVDQSAIVSRISQVVKTIDSLEPNLKASVVFPKYMEAEKVVTAIKPLFRDKESRNEFGIVAFGPANGVIITGYPNDIKTAKSILERLDIPLAAPTKTEPARFFVYNLQFAQAEDVAKILSEMLSERQKAVEEQLKEAKVPATEEAKKATADVTDNITGPTGVKEATKTVGFTSSKVSADVETNSLVLYVSPSEYDDLKTVIAKLDAERRQIEISAVVAEVSLDHVNEFSVNWQALTPGGIIGSYKGGLTEEGLLNVLAGGNFVAGMVGGDTRSITISNQTVEVPEFFAMVQALKSNTNFNLISAPRVLTQDNKQATINVGQVVPFATGGKLDALGSPTVTFDYREVGVKLEVTPHVSRTGKIRMDVGQEIQEVTGYLSQEMGGVSFSAPIVSNRSVKTTVTIPDGKTLLIGGLISKRTTDVIKGVPFLKDLPVIGPLFRDKSTSEQKVSIFISLTPKIINLDDRMEKKDEPLKPFLEHPGRPGGQQYENRDTILPQEHAQEFENGGYSQDQTEINKDADKGPQAVKAITNKKANKDLNKTKKATKSGKTKVTRKVVKANKTADTKKAKKVQAPKVIKLDTTKSITPPVVPTPEPSPTI